MGYKQYCKDYENIENYEKAKADNFKGWECHHRLETHTPDGKRRDVDVSHKELIALGLYYHRPANELIFLTKSEHSAYQKGKPTWSKGKQFSEEYRKKISEGNKGKKMSEESRNKISASKKGKQLGKDNPFYGKKHSEEAREKMREAKKGKKLSEETKKKLSEVRKGMHWFNNGKTNIKAKECPPGFVPGIIKKL